MTCQCRLINYSKCTTLVGDVDSGEDYIPVGVGGVWEISDPSSQFCSEAKPALKMCLKK